MEDINVKSLLDIIQWHDERYIFYSEIILFTENINQPFTHVAINTALDGVIDGRDAPFYFKENVKKPFGVGGEMLPMGNEHIIADRLVAVIHCLFKGGYILRRTLLDNLTKHFPVLGNVIFTILLGVADSPVTG